jgi:hypothetical protein
MTDSTAVPALLAGLALILSVGAEARADDSNKGAAQVLFEQGRALVEDKRFAEACPKFAESLRLDPGIGTMLFLADCYENSGQTASAWAEFKDAAAAAALRNDPREEIARRRAGDLESKLAKLVLVPPAEGSVPGIEVRRDGVLVGAAEYGIPVPVNPGVHEIRASAAGRRPWSTSVSLEDKPGTVSIVVPVLEVLGPEPIVPVTSPVGSTTPADRGVGARTWGIRQTLAVATAGTGLVAIGIGTYFGLHAKSTYDAWQAGGGHDAQENSSAYTQAAVSTVMFCIGAAAIAGGAVLYFTAPKSSKPGVAVVPVASPRGAGLFVARTF